MHVYMATKWHATKVTVEIDINRPCRKETPPRMDLLIKTKDRTIYII
ncbi:hypothetical protein Hanom_Chr01g00022941 [Helianthus anomalus]